MTPRQHPKLSSEEHLWEDFATQTRNATLPAVSITLAIKRAIAMEAQEIQDFATKAPNVSLDAVMRTHASTKAFAMVYLEIRFMQVETC